MNEPSHGGRRSGSTPPIDPRILQRRAAIRRGAGRRRLWRVVCGLVATVVAVGGLVVLHSSVFASRVVYVVGPHPHTGTAQILGAAGLDHPVPLIDISSSVVAARIEALPYIATARVSRLWPDGLRIAVTERIPAAVVSGPGSSWSVVDGSGRTLAVLASRPQGLAQLVVSTSKGPLAPAPVGGQLPAGADPGLEVCATLPAAFSAQVVSVTVDRAAVDLALTSGLTVKLGTAVDLAVKYEDVAAIIAHAPLVGKKVIDVTVPQAPAVG